MCKKIKMLEFGDELSIDKIRKKLEPYFAKEDRKLNGCPEGDLICENCGAENGSKNRQFISYVDSDNMAILCPLCQSDRDKYWNEMWNCIDYYSYPTRIRGD